MLVITLGTAVFLSVLSQIDGHGRLMDPPARNAMWRFGYPNPVNYNDNELYCGGFVIQYQKNKGKCGVCGDDFREEVPRSHEAGGVYANGIITKRYVMGQDIDIEAELTTNHKGNMELMLCANDNPQKIATEDCFTKYPLPLSDNSGLLFEIPEDTKKTETFRWKVKLPDGVTCNHCVIRWKYYAANTWGLCEDGSESVGCGAQETFINCADVVIYSNTPSVVKDDFNPWLLYHVGDFPGSNDLFRISPNNEMNSLKPLVVRAQVCLPQPESRHVPGMFDWCRKHCLSYPPNCHPEYCKCVYECDAVGEFAKRDQADIWCHQNCLKADPYCPSDRCRCR